MGYQLSFCIPEHNECNLVRELVQSLLSNPNPNVQVIVSDNMTDNADPSEVYRDIRDERFRLYRNEKALSLQENFLRALERGDGEYLYLVMGRDWLDSGKIDRLLSLLRLAREDHVELMLDRKSTESYRLYYGIDALNRFVRHEHPTGLIISRAALLANQRRNEYFIPGCEYPETFIKRDILATGGLSAVVSSGVLGSISTRTSLGRRLSTGAALFNDWVKFSDQLKMENVYFHPKQILQVFREEVSMVLDDPRFNLTKAEQIAYFEQKYQRLLADSTFEYKLGMQSEEYTMHYGLRRTYIPLESMLKSLINAALAGVKEAPHLSPLRKLGLAKAVCATAQKIINGRYEF